MLQFGNLGQWKDGPPDIWAVLLLAAQVLNLAKVGDKTVKLAKLREGFLEANRSELCHQGSAVAARRESQSRTDSLSLGQGVRSDFPGQPSACQAQRLPSPAGPGSAGRRRRSCQSVCETGCALCPVPLCSPRTCATGLGQSLTPLFPAIPLLEAFSAVGLDPLAPLDPRSLQAPVAPSSTVFTV